MSVRLSDHQVFHNIASSSSVFDFAQFLSLFLLLFCTSKLLEFKEFNKTITPFALLGYGTGYSQLGATRFVRYLPFIKLEIVFTRAAPAFDNLFMGCVLNINTVHKTVEKLTFQAFY